MQLKENANLSDRYYIEAPEDFEDAKKFDYAVTEMSLPTPESNWYDFDNTFIATVSEIRAMIEEYGVEPIVYESFDEENGPNGKVYDIYSLAFDADPLDECVCAGQACGTGTISDFVPEKMRGVKDIHSKDKKEDELAESKKITEAFDDDDLGYDDFDYEGEMEDYFNPNINEPNENSYTRMWADEYDSDVSDTGIPVVKSNIFGNDTDNISDEYLDMAMTDSGEYKKGNTIYGVDLDNPVKTIDLVENKKMITKEKLIESFKRVMETKEVPAENPNNYFYGKAEKNIEYSKVNPDNMKVNKKLPENKKVMPRAIRESRALPGGMLNSEEKTAYEDFLRERHLKQDKVKAKEFGKNKLGLYDDDCGENGWHNWDGTKIK